MSHTNQTPNYHLPQFIGTDKPAWLVDFNQAMSDIDTQMKANETASATAEANAQSALSGLSATNTQVSGLQTDVTAIQTQMPLDEAQIATNTQNISTQASAIVNANNRIDTANSAISALNTKVGDLVDLDTTDKTSIVNAVNELKGNITDLSALHELAKTLYNGVTVTVVGEVSELDSGSAFFNYPLLAKPDNVTVSSVEFPGEVVVTTFDDVKTSDNYFRIDNTAYFPSRKKQACIVRCTFNYT